LKSRFGTARTLYGNFVLMALDIAAIAIWSDRPTAVIVAVIVSGVFVGVNNTLVTTAVMSIAPVERPVASAAYGFVRFIGGGLAPFAAGKLAEHFGLHVPFLVGAVAVTIGIAVLATGHRMLTRADADMAGHGAAEEEVAGEVADEFGGAPGAIDDELQAEAHARA
jgi:MFS transporter, ACDE family, multidrug resistance protein